MKTFKKHKKSLRIIEEQGIEYVNIHNWKMAQIDYQNNVLIQLGFSPNDYQERLNYAAKELKMNIVLHHKLSN